MRVLGFRACSKWEVWGLGFRVRGFNLATHALKVDELPGLGIDADSRIVLLEYGASVIRRRLSHDLWFRI